MKPYTLNKNAFKSLLKEKKYKSRLQSAIAQADDASKLSLVERLGKYSFIAKYKGNLNSPKKVTKKDLIKHQIKMKRQFNVDFPIEATDEDNEPLQKKLTTKKRNMIILGTPKRVKAKRIQDSLNVVDIAAPTVTKRIQDSMDIVDTTPAIPKKRATARKRIQDSMDIVDTPALPTKREHSKKHTDKTAIVKANGETETEPTKSSSNDFKQPNSMAVHVGSTTDTAPETATESYDNGNPPLISLFVTCQLSNSWIVSSLFVFYR